MLRQLLARLMGKDRGRCRGVKARGVEHSTPMPLVGLVRFWRGHQCRLDSSGSGPCWPDPKGWSKLVRPFVAARDPSRTSGAPGDSHTTSLGDLRSPGSTGHLCLLLFVFQFSFFLLSKLGLFPLFLFAFILLSLVTHICCSFLEKYLRQKPVFGRRAFTDDPLPETVPGFLTP